MKKSIKLSIVSNHIFRLSWVLSKRVPYFKNFFRLLRFISFHSDSTDLFGTALWDYYSNDLRSKFNFHQHCLQKKYNGYSFEVDLSRYFRALPEISISLQKWYLTAKFNLVKRKNRMLMSRGRDIT